MSTQKQYSNIECELLPVVLMLEHLHHYLFGQNFTVHTDHYLWSMYLRNAWMRLVQGYSNYYWDLAVWNEHQKYDPKECANSQLFVMFSQHQKWQLQGWSHIRSVDSWSGDPQWCQNRLVYDQARDNAG